MQRPVDRVVRVHTNSLDERTTEPGWITIERDTTTQPSSFVSEDQFGLTAGDPNLYEYAAGSPTDFKDSSGNFVQAIAAGCLIGTTVACMVDDIKLVNAARKGRQGPGYGQFFGDLVKRCITGAVISVVFTVADIVGGLVFSAYSGEGLLLASDERGATGEMQVIRTLGQDEDLSSVLNAMWQASYDEGVEYAIVCVDNSVQLVRGGPGGIDLGPNVDEVYVHTHPFPASGAPSEEDFQMLDRLGQDSSFILSRDGLLPFFRK